MADGEGGEKTEKGTGRQRQRAREKGQVAKSQEASSAVLLLVVVVVCIICFVLFRFAACGGVCAPIYKENIIRRMAV